MTIRFHKGDLADLSNYDVDAVAIDTETLGLNPHRDRLCVVQISPGDGTADVIQIAAGQKEDHQALPLWPVRPRGALPGVRRDA
jgi:ribonuclease D